EAAEALVVEVEQRLALSPRAARPADERALHGISEGTDYRLPNDPFCHVTATDPPSLALATTGPLYPAHVGLLGPGMPIPAQGDDLAAKAARTVPPPVALLVPGRGALIRRDASPGAEAMLSCLALVMSRLPLDASIKYLSSDNEQALLNWDAEHYRKQMTVNR